MNTTFLGARSVALTIAAATAAASLPTAAAAQVAGWHGRYVWEEDVGRRGGTDPGDSIAAFITYRLQVGPNAGSTGCRLEGQGLQTNKRILCTITPQRGSAIVKFYGYGPDNMFDDGYRRGQTLFTLTRGPRGITTTLQALKPSNRATPRSGTLFRRAG
ncbi:hypothetical protein COC42_08425 [Sphingomonas spermidinifaciens]|uniref:DUF3617 domain-containing protein n=1 Tax=Sphingomonas spermidinifaciens TaxID=1141889 RepID=A0A2A4B9F9_9SPHN|nr:DUF5991 domain-containing protein [Sphingomonas spermidinifaciens]PCD04296.1 hypothetical protein COC42_08425 [Sphingomonas spermidinifaciens]